MHVVGTSPSLLHPGHHRVSSAHHFIQVPVGHVVAKTHIAQTIDHCGQVRIGLQRAAVGVAHVGRTDEEQRGVGTDALDTAYLALHDGAIFVDGCSAVGGRHLVTTELQDNQPNIRKLVAFAQDRVGDKGELVAGGAAQRDIIDAHARTVVNHDAVNVGRALHVDTQRSSGSVCLPAECVNSCARTRACGVVVVFAVREGGAEFAVMVIVEEGDAGEPFHAVVGALVGGGIGGEGAAAGESVAFQHEAVVALCPRPVAVGRVEGEGATGRLAHGVGGNCLDGRQ